jgi:hypothetical protein
MKWLWQLICTGPVLFEFTLGDDSITWCGFKGRSLFLPAGFSLGNRPRTDVGYRYGRMEPESSIFGAAPQTAFLLATARN